jgi:murein DD-endopeptidase MepM/ murein hydrolase activator NlpD
VAIPKHGTNPGWIAWPGTQVIAAGPGKVWSAKLTGLGHSVLIDHGSVDGVPMLTFYQHLERFARDWQKGDLVSPGTPLGIMGGDPSNVPHLRHLHFEVWLPEGKAHEGDWPVNPDPYLKMWAQL